MTTKSYHNRQATYTDQYVIEYKLQSDGSYVMYCTHHPKNKFSNLEPATHMHPHSGKLCVAEGKEPRSLEMAEAIAYYWMCRFSEYVRTGEFRDTGSSVNV